MICLVGLLLGPALPGVAAALEKWGPFRGQLVDVETGQPIAGAAVLVTWWKVIPNPAGGTEKFYDAREAVSDAAGRFEVARFSPPFFRFGIQPPQLTYFAPGYKPVAEVVTPPEGQPFVAPTVVQMRRLKTRQELLEKSRARPAGVPLGKMTELTKAVNTESRMLGLDELPVIHPRK
jgi:hypothetical protein